MPDQMTCAQGHSWPLDSSQGGDQAAVEQLCPHCGGAAVNDARLNDAHSTLDDAARTATFTPGADRIDVAAPLPKTTVVAGYEVVGVLGRGGMGIVYLARQQKLKRLVALKMTRAADQPGAIERFRVEAEAVARLQHPNVVQIFEIGEDQGQPFVALEYVEGGSLANKLAANPMAAREAAQLAETIARAVQSAHEHGVVHRDLKPANVLLTKDGAPKITDFGIAKQLDVDTGHTQMGQVLGTPSYMAPEQARGDAKAAGPLADVYALGAMLYEMLTGRPPFKSASVLDTLEQVRTQEPVPPRQLQPKTPVDLETICLKCLQKETSKRYTSAAECADDLRRFLHGEPIRARPVGTLGRLARWCKRNPKIAALSAASIILLIFALGVSTAFAVTFRRQSLAIRAEQETTEQARIAAQNEATEAKKQRKRAEEALTISDEQRKLAIEARKIADDHAQTATAQATLALTTIQTMADKVQRQLAPVPGTQQLRKDILEHALMDLTRVANMIDKSTSKEATQLAIHNQLGKVFRQLGETDKAAVQFAKALAIARERVEIKQGSDSSRGNLAASLREMGAVTQETGREMSAALGFFREALAVRQAILDAPKLDPVPVKRFIVRYELAEDHTRVAATLYRLGDPAEAMPHFRQARDLRQELSQTAKDHPDLASFPPAQRLAVAGQLVQDLTRSNLALAEMSFRLGDAATCLTGYAQATAVRQKIYDANPKNPASRFELARTHGNFGDVHLALGRHDEARDHYDKALEHLRALVKIDANVVDYQRDLGLAHYRLGNLERRKNDSKAARAHFDESLRLRQSLAANDPANDRRQLELMLALAHCQQLEPAAELAAKYRQRPKADNELLLDVARCYAVCAAHAPNPAAAADFAQQAVEAIGQAIANGYKDRVYLNYEPDYDALRALPAFKTLIERAPWRKIE